MITDAYTREYDERQAKLAYEEKVGRLSKAMEKLCLGYYLRVTGDDVRVTVLMPYGGRKRYFRTMDKAIAWAENPFGGPQR